MKILKVIHDAEPQPQNETIKRFAVRAILFDEQRLIPLLFVQKYNYHKLPGGDLEAREEPGRALSKLLEETGCRAEITQSIGRIVEYRSQYNLEQTSDCYLGHVKSKTRPNFTAKETDEGFELVWLNLSEAIKTLESDQPSNYEGLFVQPRELTFLNQAKKIIQDQSKKTNPVIKSGTKRSDIKPGLKVAIVLKKDQPTGELTTGVVKDILTGSSEHHRGIKVRLQDGRVGRVQQIFN